MLNKNKLLFFIVNIFRYHFHVIYISKNSINIYFCYHSFLLNKNNITTKLSNNKY